MSEDKATFPVVILAAGGSKRFGSPKQLAELNGEPLLVSVIKKLLACKLEPYISLGANIEVISRHQAMQPFNHLIIPVKNWASGLSESIKESIAFFDDRELSGVIFFLGDQPLIDSEYLMRFISSVKEFPTALICTSYEGESADSIGVPAYFPKAYFKELCNLEGDQGAKIILKNNNPLVLMCETGLLDIDEPEDLAHAKFMLG